MRRRLWLAILVVASMGSPIWAQNGTVIPVPKAAFYDNNGDPCAGCKLYAFTAGTSTPLDTYSEVTLATPNANPVILDAAGRATIYLSASSYKFQLDGADDVTIWTQDNVTATHAGLLGVSNTGDVVFQVDTDDDGSNKFSFLDGDSVEVAQINESGNLQIDGGIFVGDTPSIFGAAVVSDVDALWDFRGTHTGTTNVYGVEVSSSLTVPASGQGLGLFVSPTLVEAASGTHALLAGARFVPPVVTAGAATVTDAATVYVGGAPTATVTGNNYSLWVDAGTVRFDGTTRLDGGLDLSSGTGAVAFPGTQTVSADVNTLDDYEEGTWTPVIGGATSESGQAYAVAQGRYVKIGRLVMAHFNVQLSTEGTITGNITLRGLPFTINNATNQQPSLFVAYWAGLATTWVFIGGFGNVNTTTAGFYGATAAAVGLSPLTNTDTGDNSQFLGSIMYYADS